MRGAVVFDLWRAVCSATGRTKAPLDRLRSRVLRVTLGTRTRFGCGRMTLYHSRFACAANRLSGLPQCSPEPAFLKRMRRALQPVSLAAIYAHWDIACGYGGTERVLLYHKHSEQFIEPTG